jgi:hypothetical protein
MYVCVCDCECVCLSVCVCVCVYDEENEGEDIEEPVVPRQHSHQQCVRAYTSLEEGRAPAVK